MHAKQIFQKAMDYIDRTILETKGKGLDTDFRTYLKAGLEREIGYNCARFGVHFEILTRRNLDDYIMQRRLHFVEKAMIETDEKIGSIIHDFHFSDQGNFNREYKKQTGGQTPRKARKERKYSDFSKLCWSDFNDKSDTRVQKMLYAIEHEGFGELCDTEYWIYLHECQQEYKFDIDTIYQISDLAETLNIDEEDLMMTCRRMVDEENWERQTNPNYLSPEDKKAIEMGLSSYAELEYLCNYYDCKYYELDKFCIKYYKDVLKKDKVKGKNKIQAGSLISTNKITKNPLRRKSSTKK